MKIYKILQIYIYLKWHKNMKKMKKLTSSVWSLVLGALTYIGQEGGGNTIPTRKTRTTTIQEEEQQKLGQ